MQAFCCHIWHTTAALETPQSGILQLCFWSPLNIKEGQILDVDFMKHQINKETIRKKVTELQVSAENSGFDREKHRCEHQLGGNVAKTNKQNKNFALLLLMGAFTQVTDF